MIELIFSILFAFSDVCPVGLTEGSIEHDGQERTYLMYVPENVTEPAPLVLSFHGFGSNPNQQMRFSEWNEVADEHGFILVYPRATGFPPGWNTGEVNLAASLTRGDVDDLGFIAALIDSLSDCIDSDRVYANGLSNGGGMSHYLACELSDRITAIGTVAGAYSDLACESSVPVIAFHGTADDIVPYEGGRAGLFILPDIQTWVDEWAERNGCDSTPEALPEQGDVIGIEYVNCDAPVIFYTIDEGGHNWPGGSESQPEFFVGKVSRDIDASEVMWAFFSEIRR